MRPTALTRFALRTDLSREAGEVDLVSSLCGGRPLALPDPRQRLLHVPAEHVFRRSLPFQRDFRRHRPLGPDAPHRLRGEPSTDGAPSRSQRSPRSRNAPCNRRISRSCRCRTYPSPSLPSARGTSSRSPHPAGSRAAASRNTFRVGIAPRRAMEGLVARQEVKEHGRLVERPFPLPCAFPWRAKMPRNSSLVLRRLRKCCWSGARSYA